MLEWPAYVIYAFEMMSYMRPYNEETVKEITNHWGRLDQETFVHILHEGQGEYKVLAIFALGHIGTSLVHELLLPFLQSPTPMERWASALSLGKMKEEQALPILIDMLTEYLPPHEQYTSEKIVEWRYDYWRSQIPSLLAVWEYPTLAPPLRHALQTVLQIEQAISPKPSQKEMWKRYKREVVYALGQLDAFGALTGLEEGELQMKVWMVHLIMGHLHRSYPTVNIVKWKQKPELEEEVTTILEQVFGLTAKEREDCLILYEKEILRHNYLTFYEDKISQEK